MKDLTLIIPTKKEVESLPIFLKELNDFDCEKLIVLQKEDLETRKAIEKIENIHACIRLPNHINDVFNKKSRRVDGGESLKKTSSF